MKKLIVLLMVACLVGLSMANIIIMDPTTNNGSFETPVRPEWDNTGVMTGWNHPGGDTNFNTRKPGYLVGYTDGSQGLNVTNLAGWYSDVLTIPVPAGEIVSFSVDLGWDSWVNASPAVGATAYLYAVDPANYANNVLMSTITATPTWTYATDAGWVTASNGAGTLMQGAWNNWYFQVVVASGGNANNLIDNFVITATPEPATMVLLGLGGLFLRRKK